MADCSFDRIEALRKPIDEQLEYLVLLAQHGYVHALFRLRTTKFTITDFLKNHEEDSAVRENSYFGYEVGRGFGDLYTKKFEDQTLTNQAEHTAEHNLFYSESPPEKDDETLATVLKKLRRDINIIITCLENYVQEAVLNPQPSISMEKLRAGYNPDFEFRLYAYYAFYKWCKENILYSGTANDHAIFSLGLLYYAHKTTGVARGNSGRELGPLEFLLHLFAKSAKHHASFPYNDEDIPETTEYYSESSRAKAHERRRVYNNLRDTFIQYEDEGVLKQETAIIHSYRIDMGPNVKRNFVDSFLRGDGGASALWNQYDGFSYTRFGRRKPKRKSRRNSKSKFGRPTKRRSSAKKRTGLRRR